MAPNSTTSTRLASGRFQSSTCSTTPSPMPAASAVGRLSILAITATARARSSMLGPNVSPLLNPRVGCVRIAVIADNPPESAHARADIRAAGMAAMRAASGLAAEERIARPYLLYLRNAASPSTARGANTIMPV